MKIMRMTVMMVKVMMVKTVMKVIGAMMEVMAMSYEDINDDS